MRRLVDCFLFYNELDLLEYRFKVLNPVIDVFVMVEASRTFMGKEKPFVFRCNQERFRPYLNKITCVLINEVPFRSPDVSRGEQWQNESFQRDALLSGLQKVSNLSGSDIVLLSDVDEIFDPDSLAGLRNVMTDDTLYIFKQQYHSYNLNVMRDAPWYHAKAFTYECWQKTLLQASFSNIRLRGVTQSTSDVNLACVQRGGWHLSWFGDASFIANKLANFSHQELDIEKIRDPDYIQQCMNDGKDVAGDSALTYRIIPACRNPYLPPRYDEWLAVFLLM